MTGPLAVSVDRLAPVPIARLVGEIDRSNAGTIEPELLALAPGPVIVDLSGLAFLSSAGLCCSGWRSAVRIAVVAPPAAPFRRALDVAELARVAHVADSTHAALEHFGAP